MVGQELQESQEDLEQQDKLALLETLDNLADQELEDHLDVLEPLDHLGLLENQAGMVNQDLMVLLDKEGHLV